MKLSAVVPGNGHENQSCRSTNGLDRESRICLQRKHLIRMIGLFGMFACVASMPS